MIPAAAEPLNLVEGAGTLADVPLSRPGTYRLRIEYRETVLAEWPILIGSG